MKLTIWINAFIPGTVAGYTVTVPTGPHAGKTAVPLPGVALINPLNWTSHANNGFLTDQRGFSQAPSASVRMQSKAIIELEPLSLLGQSHTTSGTTHVDTKTGVSRGFAKASMVNCTFSTVAATLRPAPSGPSLLLPAKSPAASPLLKLRLEAAASDPLVSASADIDYSGDFTITPPGVTGVVTVEFVGLLDSFPAFEAYASYGGVTKTLFTSAPPAGNTVVDLLGAADRPIAAKVSF